MARLPRLVLPGHVHLVVLRGHSGRPAFADETDRSTGVHALREAAARCRVALHAWAITGHELLLLATPPDATALGRMMQAMGRRYVSAHNRRHGRSGTLWDGRFRCAVIEPGAAVLDALCLVDGASAEPGATSAAHRCGGRREADLVDPAEYWQLGNTPFEREADYRRRLAQGLPPARAVALRQAALGGWAIGSDSFLAGLSLATGRPARPRLPGRPRRAP